jgi:hypothetical protein
VAVQSSSSLSTDSGPPDTNAQIVGVAPAAFCFDAAATNSSSFNCVGGSPRLVRSRFSCSVQPWPDSHSPSRTSVALARPTAAAAAENPAVSVLSSVGRPGA